MQKAKTGRLKIAVVILLAVIGAAAFWFWRQSSEPERQPADVVRRTSVAYIVEADGTVESAQLSEVFAPTALKIKEITVKEGDFVQENDLLAVLDTEEWELEIRRAELTIESAEASLSGEQRAQSYAVAAARGSVTSAETARQAARRAYDELWVQRGQEASVVTAQINRDAALRAAEHSRELWAIGELSQEALTQAENALDMAQTAYDNAVLAASDALDRARETLDAAEVRYANASTSLSDAQSRNTDPAAASLALQMVALEEKKLKLKDARVTAPSAGRVTLVNAKLGATASGLLFVIEDDQTLVVKARVSEADIMDITLETPVEVQPAGRAQIWEGVTTVLPVTAERDASGALTAGSGDDVYFIVEAALDTTQPGILIGMNANVRFIIEKSEDCLAVPRGLVYENDGQTSIITRENGVLVEKPVQIGLTGKRMAEIIGDGLFEGMELFER